MRTMEMKKTRWITSGCALAVLLTAGLVWAAGNIDTSDKYAWSEASGWQNWNATHGGVTVTPDGASGYLSGYAWCENIGWVKLGDGTGPYANNSATDWGVNMDASGNLSGYAWSEVAGWINFNPTHSQVTINTSTGEFDGYAWCGNTGWVHFKNTSPAYTVKTSASFGGPPPSGTQGTVFRFR